MIQEDYVSIETAKLLKEKGFNGVCLKYALNGEIYNKGDIVICHKDDVIIGIPTLQMARKWLKEVHHLYCSIEFNPHSLVHDDKRAYWLFIYKTIFDNPHDSLIRIEPFVRKFKTDEEACEAGIKYCLENLI